MLCRIEQSSGAHRTESISDGSRSHSVSSAVLWWDRNVYTLQLLFVFVIYIKSFNVIKYECCCNDFSETDVHDSVYSASQIASTQHSVVEQPLDQPNIDLQVTLTQRWPGLSALLIDIAPYCLMANECDLELTVVEENGGVSWRLPAGKTFSPPFFHEVNFFISPTTSVL